MDAPSKDLGPTTAFLWTPVPQVLRCTFQTPCINPVLIGTHHLLTPTPTIPLLISTHMVSHCHMVTILTVNRTVHFLLTPHQYRLSHHHRTLGHLLPSRHLHSADHRKTRNLLSRSWAIVSKNVVDVGHCSHVKLMVHPQILQMTWWSLMKNDHSLMHRMSHILVDHRICIIIWACLAFVAKTHRLLATIFTYLETSHS